MSILPKITQFDGKCELFEINKMIQAKWKIVYGKIYLQNWRIPEAKAVN